MSLKTYSIFYYGFGVDDSNYQLDFDEGSGELTAEVDFGDYSFTEFIAKVQEAMNAVGGQVYTLNINRSTRAVTISSTGNFSLLTQSGTHGNTIFPLLGFSGADKTGASSYTGSASGSAYEPQYKLQSYVGPENNKVRRNVSVQEAATGKVKSISFGDVRMIDMDIRFTTNIFQPSNGPIKNNQSGVDDLNHFMQHCISKAPVEFMPDIGDRNTFYDCILDRTSDDQNGAAYSLLERFDLGTPGYYDTQLLKFRVLPEE
jgi:hypothetical protein